MNKKLIDKAWSVLPAEFRKEVKKCYQYAQNHFTTSYLQRGASDTFEHLFGIHNLTSNTEGEENLQDMLYHPFSSKCVPDEEPKFKVGDEVVWDKRIIAYVDKILNDGDYIIYFRVGHRCTVHGSDLEPYTEPEDLDKRSSTCTDDCPSQCPSPDHFPDPAKMVNNILKDSLRDHNRLHIASVIMAGLLASGKEKHPVRRTLELTDTLIIECKKG